MSTKAWAAVRRGLFRGLPFAIAVCGFAATILLNEVLVRRERAQVIGHTEEEARHVAAQLRVGIPQVFEPLQRVAAWWLLQGRPMAPEDWETDAQLLGITRAGLQTLVWLQPDGVRSWSARPGAPAEADSTRTSDPILLETVRGARRSGSLALSRVFEANQMDLIFAASPVKRQGRLLGFIAGLYDVAGLLHSVTANQLPDNYEVLVKANSREIRVTGESTFTVLPESARTAEIHLPNTVWSVVMIPSGRGVTTVQRLILVFGFLVSVLLYACATIAMFARERAARLKEANRQLHEEIVERSQAEVRIGELNRDLHRRLAEFQTLLDVLPVGIAIAEDAECRTIWSNRALAGMLGVPLGHNISQSRANQEKPGYKILRNGMEVAPEELPMQVAVRTCVTVANDPLDIVRSDGSVLHTLSYSAPLFDEAGSVRGVVNACVDMTEHKALEQRVQRAEKFASLALMAGGIAHDFNNLLTVIIGHASYVAAGLPERSPIHKRIEELQTAAERAADLVAQLLAFTGHFWWDAQPLNLSAEIEKMKSGIRNMMDAGIAVKYDLAGDLPLIEGGGPEIRQVIRNLAANAREALAGGNDGEIDIRTSRADFSASELKMLYPEQPLAPGAYVRLEVIDSGCGIPSEIAGRIFDPFFTTKFVGRGLGLSAVQGIVRAHRGGIRFESYPDHGTRVEIIFPAYSAGAIHPEITALENATPGPAVTRIQ